MYSEPSLITRTTNRNKSEIYSFSSKIVEKEIKTAIQIQKQKQVQQIINQPKHPNVILFLLQRLVIKRLRYTSQKIKIIPKRDTFLKCRLKDLIGIIFKRQDYQEKWNAVQKIKKQSLAHQQKEIASAEKIVKEMKVSAMRVIIYFVNGKRKNNFKKMIDQLKNVGDLNVWQKNTRMRKGFRLIVKQYVQKKKQIFNRIRCSRIIQLTNSKCILIYRLMKKIYEDHMKTGLLKLQRNYYVNKMIKTETEVKELDQKLTEKEDQEITSLKDKQIELDKQLDEIKAQKDKIQQDIKDQIGQIQQRNQEMQRNIQELKDRKNQLQNLIKKADQQVNQPLTLDEIHDYCFKNLLLVVESKSNEKVFTKEELLNALQYPLLPVDYPLQKLKQENEALKQLLNEYILIFGEKKLPEGMKIDLPYDRMVKENRMLHRILLVLVPKAVECRTNMNNIRNCVQGLENSLNQLSHD